MIMLSSPKLLIYTTNSVLFLVNAGLKLLWPDLLNLVYSRTSNAQLKQNDSSKSCEEYLMNVLTNPLTLKQSARILIRNRIINNMKNFQFVRNFVFTSKFYRFDTVEKTNVRNYYKQKYSNSIFQTLIWELSDLPKILHHYLYAFPDLSPVTSDLRVFIND